MINGMECEWHVYQAKSSSKVSFRGGEGLGMIGLKSFVELRGRQWEERVVGFNFVLYALCDFEPVERFEVRSDMIVFRCFSDSTSSRVENKL